MKKVNILIGLALAATVFVGCKEPKSPAVSNSVYIADAASSNTKKVATDAAGGRATLTARVADFVGENVYFDWEVDTTILDTYNKKNETTLVPLPADYYKLDKSFDTIKVNSVSSKPLTIKIESLNSLPSSVKYAIPVKISNIKGSGVLESSKSIVLVLDRVIYTKAWNMAGNFFALTFPEHLKLSLPVFTIEFLIRPLSLNPSNMALYMMYGPDHSATNGYEVFSRFGDVAIANEQLQVKTQQQQPATGYRFVINKWQHVAYVYNGTSLKIVVDGKTDVNFPTPIPGLVYLATRMQFGGSSIKAEASEIRLWNVVRTEAQLVDAKYTVDPASKGLVAYWKCDDESSGNIKDYTGHGYDVVRTSTAPYQWVDVRFPEL